MFTIKLASSSNEKSRAFDYLSRIIFKTYGNYPSPLDEKMNLLVMERNHEIIGTIGIYFDENKYDSPLYNLYDVKEENQLLKENEKLSFISRWVVTENQIGIFLSYFAGRYILDKGFNIGSCILKDKVATYLNKISNNSWAPLINSRCILEKIEADDLKYFTSIPTPQPYIGDIEKFVTEVSKRKVISTIEKLTKIKF